MTKIGMIGIGLMGHGIARSIQRHGHSLNVLEHPGNQPLDDLMAHGARTFSQPAQLAADSDAVILCVTGTPQVEAVLLGADGVVQGLRPGTIVIDCSTAIPSSTLEMAGAVIEAGGRFMDAPMTRTPAEAAQGRLNLLVGADPALFDECLPILKCFAEHIVHAGGVGAGHQMKLLHNFVSLGFVALLAEAGASARRLGIAPDMLIDVLAQGGGGGAALDRVAPYLRSQDASALRFGMGNARKDLSYYTTMAGQAGAVSVIAQAVSQTFERGVRDGGPLTPILELVEQLSGDRRMDVTSATAQQKKE